MEEPQSICGIDFSAHQKKAGAYTWITVGVADGGGLKVTECIPAERLPGSGKDRVACMAGLRRFLVGRPSMVTGLDFPFGLPRSLVPEATWQDFVFSFVRRYPTAEQLRLACRQATSPYELKRTTDLLARTPFSPYNIRVFRQTYAGIAEVLAPLVREDAVRVLPMQAPADGKPTLVEICPASSLQASLLRMPYKGRGTDLRSARAHILAGIEAAGLVWLPTGLASVIADDSGGDALDSLIAAVSVHQSLSEIVRAAESASDDARIEGWVYFALLRGS